MVKCSVESFEKPSHQGWITHQTQARQMSIGFCESDYSNWKYYYYYLTNVQDQLRRVRHDWLFRGPVLQMDAMSISIYRCQKNFTIILHKLTFIVQYSCVEWNDHKLRLTNYFLISHRTILRTKPGLKSPFYAQSRNFFGTRKRQEKQEYLISWHCSSSLHYRAL